MKRIGGTRVLDPLYWTLDKRPRETLKCHIHPPAPPSEGMNGSFGLSQSD